jgi:hypothetical protein
MYEEDEIDGGKSKVADGQVCGLCVIPGCDGKITAHVSSRCKADLGNMIIGPGGASQWEESVIYACNHCHVMYVSPPRKRPRRIREAERAIG